MAVIGPNGNFDLDNEDKEMEQILKFDTVGQYNQFNNNKTLHPLVSIIDFSKATPRQLSKINYGFYAIFLKEVKCGDLKYGCNYYDYQEGTLVFVSPGQIVGSFDPNSDFYQPKGCALVFHPDFIHGTAFGRKIQEYTFFSYEVYEALHLSETEKKIVTDCFGKIQFELEHSIDKHSRQLIITNIELLLNYCIRFYDRQFITRENVNKGILERFEDLLTGYFQSDSPQTQGLPTVNFCADNLNLSANYFGDLIKKQTGKSAQEYIHLKIMGMAKEKMFDPNKSVGEIGYSLGFKYPQHFSRFFKQHMGQSPNEFRNMN